MRHHDHRWTGVAAGLLLATTMLAGCGRSEAGGLRITHSLPDGDVELIVQGDRYRFRLTSEEESFWTVRDGKRVLSVEHEGSKPGPDSEYRLYLDVTRQPEELHAGFVVPDVDEAPGLVPFSDTCHRLDTGEYAGRPAERYHCSGGDAGEKDVWVDQATRVVLTPWGIDRKPKVEEYDAPADTFSTEVPKGARDVRVIRPELRKGDEVATFTARLLDARGRPGGTGGNADLVGPYAIVQVSSPVFQADPGREGLALVAPLRQLSRQTKDGTEPTVLVVIDLPQEWWGGFTRRGIDLPVLSVKDPYRLASSLGLPGPYDSATLVLVGSDGRAADVLDLRRASADQIRAALAGLS